MEMPRISQLRTLTTRVFKIDLIVWKSDDKIEFQISDTMFKIDLIVWK